MKFLDGGGRDMKVQNARNPKNALPQNMIDVLKGHPWVLIFIIVFAFHFVNTTHPLCDSIWSIHTSMGIIKNWTTSIDEYEEIVKKYNYYATERIDGHLYTVYPLGVSVIAAPFVLVYDKVLSLFFNMRFNELISHSIPNGLQGLIASSVIALTAVFIYLIAQLSLDMKYSIFLVFIFSFCTSAWSIASRALWQHGPSMLMLSLSLYLILISKEKPARIQYVGLPLAFSYVIRPTNQIPIILLTIFIFLRYRKYFMNYILWASIIAIPFVVFNIKVHHSLLPSYYLPKRFAFNTDFLVAMAGNLISPNRGLFVFTPILIFSLYGIFIEVRNRKLDQLGYFLLGILVLHWLLISSFHPWWGGHSYGPRFFSDMIPFLIYFMIPALASLSKLIRERKLIFAYVFIFLTLISFFIHYRGATTSVVHAWNSFPHGRDSFSSDIDSNPIRTWDWQDIQFLAGIPLFGGSSKYTLIDWVAIPGYAESAPVLAWNPIAKRLHLVVRHKNIWTASFGSGGGFNNDWVAISGKTTDESPAVAWNPFTNKLQMVIKAPDKSLWGATFDSKGNFANDWVAIPGRAESAPALAWNPIAKRLHLVVRHKTIWAASFGSGGGFNNDWVAIPGKTDESPAVAWNPFTNKLQMVIKAPDKSLWGATFDSKGTFANDWVAIPGYAESAPVLAWSPIESKMFLTVRGPDDTIRIATFDSKGIFLNNWFTLPGKTGSAVPLIWNPMTEQFQTIVRATDDSLWTSKIDFKRNIR